MKKIVDANVGVDAAATTTKEKDARTMQCMARMSNRWARLARVLTLPR